MPEYYPKQNLEHVVASSPKFSFRPRAREQPAKETPGPGQYECTDTKSRRYERVRAHGFGTAARTVEYNQRVPGPGAYQQPDYGEAKTLPQASPQWRFGNQEKYHNPHARHRLTPGPGSYETHELGTLGSAKVKAQYRKEQYARAGKDPSSFHFKQKLADFKGMQQIEGRLTPDMIEASKRIRACKPTGDWAAALEHLRSLDAPPFSIQAVTLDVLTNALRSREAWELWRGMPSTEHKPSQVSVYGMMIKMSGRIKRVHDAEELFAEMQQAGLEPSIVTYSCMISAYAMVGKWEEANELLAQIRGTDAWAGYETASKQIVINAAITACGRKGEYAEARKLLESMRGEGIPVLHSHYNALLTACASARDAATADAVIAEMRAAGLEPRAADFTIRMASSLDDLRACEAIFQELRDKQLKPNRFTFEAMAEAFLQAGDAARANELLVSARAECTMPPTKKTEQLESDVAAAIRRASNHAAVETHALPDGWSSALCPSSGAPYYWRDTDPASTVTWVHP